MNFTLYQCQERSRCKPQISSSPGVSPKQRNRYRVTLGEEVLGDRLTLDQALEQALLNTHKNTLS